MRSQFRFSFIRHRGFTLIELLIVIVIIIALAAVVIPMARNIRDSARTAKTVAHLRQIQVANASWASDNSGFFLGNSPDGSGGIWSNPWWAHMPFVSMLGVNSSGDSLPEAWGTGYPEVLKCGIAAAVDAAPRDDRNFTIAMNMTSWSHNQDGSPCDPSKGPAGFWVPGKVLQSRIKDPSRFITFYEAASFVGSMYNRLEWKGDKGSQNQGMAFRNKGGRCNVVFADGHVGSLTLPEVKIENDNTRRYFLWDAD